MPKPKMKTLGRRVELKITEKQHTDISGCINGRGGNQDLYRKLHGDVQVRDGGLILPIYDVELEKLKKLAGREDPGTWQETARDLLRSNSIAW